MNVRFSVLRSAHAAPIGSSLGRNSHAYQFLIRSFLPIIAISALLSSTLGCHKKITPPVLGPQQTAPSSPTEPAPQAITPTVIPASKPEPVELSLAPVTVSAPSSLETGEASFKAGDYSKAVRSFEDYLKTDTKSENRDLALFYLGLSRALANNANRSLRRAEDALKRLIAEFPTSPYRGPAELILGLQSQVDSLQSDLKEKEAKIKQLSEELQKLKEIDMQRRPSRPPD
jgi:hypothetical protein